MGKHHAIGPMCLVGICASVLLASKTQGWGVETTTENFVAKASIIKGETGSGSAISYMALGLFNQTLYAGTITAVSSNSIIDANASWSHNEYDGANNVHFIEFENGAMADILLTDAANHRLSIPGTLPEEITVGSTFKIRKHVTIADVFGPNNEAGLEAGFNANEADNILMLLPETQTSLTFFYADIPGFEGWYRHDYLEASETIIYPEQGFVIRRRAVEDLTIASGGVARKGPSQVPIYPGYNLLNIVQNSGGMTLTSLNLYTGNSNTGVAPGNNPTVADNVVMILPDLTSRTFFYSSVPGFSGWYDVSYTPSDNTVIQAGTAFFINRKSQHPLFKWNIPAE